MTSGDPLQQNSNPRFERLDHHNGVVRAVQITDTHLSETVGGTLLGMDTDHSLGQVIGRVEKERGRPDLLLLTGDLSDYGSDSAYVRMAGYARKLAQACFWLPGNHDDRLAMSATVADGVYFRSEIRIANWQIIMLDSQVPGQAAGRLGPEQLAILADALRDAARENLHTLVCLHHHPVEIGCAWLDEQIVADAELMFEIIDAHSAVKGILWGHIHQQIDLERNGVALMGSPSTCVQFAPGSEEFKADDLPPGYRWLDLHPDGSIETGVSRVEGVEFTVELDSKGYL